MPIFKYRRVPHAELRAFSVHVLTASGAFLAFIALVAAGDHHFEAMFWWLGASLFVDGIDGPIARKLDVQAVLPNWSGIMLDNVIDYVTYVLIPAYALTESGIIGVPLSFAAAGLMVISSAIYYADTRMKTADCFFSGFPVAWNMVVFALFVVNPGQYVAMTAIIISVILTFLPINFLHPVRVVRLRPLNLGVFAVWSVFGVIALIRGFDSPAWLVWGVVASSLYLYFIGAVLQFVPNSGRDSAQS